MFPTEISTRARLWARSPAMATAGAAAAPPQPRRGLSTARAAPPPTAAPLLRLMKVRPSPWAPISLPPAPRRGFPAADMASAGRILADEEEEEEGPVAMELEPIGSEQQLDRALAEAQQLGQPIVVLWMASWCRKCIYLKPKLEKMAADYYPRIRFYCVDVNAVPQKLVNRAGVTKMPAIQLWSDSQKQAEVVGGQKAWLVIDDVRKMIEQDE